MNKLQDFIKRNRKRNSHLYENDKVEFRDYIVCPVSGARLSMIKSSYIERILNMTVDEYDEKYPGARTVSLSRKKNISQGLQQIDAVTGMTKYEISQIQARKILSTPDDNGITGYQHKGKKTRQTHLSIIDDLGRNGYSRIATTAIIKGNRTKAEKGLITYKTERNEFRRYRTIVEYITSKNKKNLCEGYLTGLAGSENSWHVDHRYSVFQGFKNQVSPLVIASICNLEMLPWNENVKKRTKCSIKLEELLNNTGYTMAQSTKEYNDLLQIIKADMGAEISPNAAYTLERYRKAQYETQS